MHHAAAVVPPKGWTPRKQGYNPAHIDFQIPHPIRQIATGTRGLYRLLLVSGKTQDVAKVCSLDCSSRAACIASNRWRIRTSRSHHQLPAGTRSVRTTFFTVHLQPQPQIGGKTELGVPLSTAILPGAVQAEAAMLAGVCTNGH